MTSTYLIVLMFALSHGLTPSNRGRPVGYRRGLYSAHYRHRDMVQPPARSRAMFSSLWGTSLNHPRPGRKVTANRNPSLASPESALRRDPYEFDNFVTPREEFPLKNSYEVTTEQFEDTEPPSAAPLTDSDSPIAIDDEEDDESVGVEPVGWRRPDLLYHGHRTSHGQGRYRWFKKKPTGRVRMQVFRGPNRKYGHKSYAQWGYYVVQPAESVDHHRLYKK